MDPTASRYSAAQRRFHWIVFALVACAYLFGELHNFFERGTAPRQNLMQAHFLVGLTVLLLVLPRLLTRLRRGVPPITPPLPAWQHALSWLTHALLYLFLFAQPVLGILTVWANGRGIPIFLTGLELPSPMAEDHDLHERLEEIHVWLGEAFYWVIGLHVLAGLYHHFGRRDDTLRRML